MPRNGVGVYAPPAGQPAVAGTTILATTHNTLVNDLSAAITASIAVDGQTPAQANLPMGGYKHTGCAVATVRTDYATAGQVQDGSLVALTGVAGTANAITATAPVSMSAYAAGQRFSFVVGTTNTGSATINLNSIGARTIKKYATQDIAAGDLLAGSVAEVIYDGTYFQLLGKPSGEPAFCAYRSASTQTVSAGAATKAQLNSEEFDTDAAFDNATNYRFAPLVAGYYAISGQITGYASGALTNVSAAIRKNGSAVRTASCNTAFNANSSSVVVAGVIYLNGSTDYVELWGLVSGSGTLGFLVGQDATFLQGHYARRG